MSSSEAKNESSASPGAGGNPTLIATSSETTTGDPTNKTSAEESLHKAIEGIPVMGATLVFVVKKWGLTGLLLFFSGGVFALGLVYFGVIPGGIVSDKYKVVGAVTKHQEGIALKGSIPLEIAVAEASWLQALIALYRHESIDAQEVESNKQSSVDAVEHTIQDTTKPFAWKLSTQSNFEMTGIAFRVMRDVTTGAELVEPLKSEGDTNSLVFSVPECREGDRLIAVVRVWSQVSLPPEDIRVALRSAVK